MAKTKTPVKSLNVNIQVGDMNNFRCLPKWFDYKDTRIRISTNEYEYEVHESEVRSNYDLCITSNLNITTNDAINLVGPEGFWINTRLPKLQQAIVINRIYNKHKARLPNFRPVGAFYQPELLWGNHAIDIPNHISKVVIKGQLGARGIGQLVVNLATAPLAGVLTEISRSVNKPLVEENGIKVSKSKPEDVLSKFVGLTYNTDGEISEGEGWQHFKDKNVFIQEYVNFISNEYRVLRYPGDGCIYICERPINGGSKDFPQAGTATDRMLINGGYLRKLDNFPLYNNFTASMAREIKLMIESIGDSSIGSFDIFVTEHGEWGIFEFSNQFAVDDYCNAFTVEFHKAAVIAALKQRDLL